MIDFELIQASTEHSIKILESRQSTVCPSLYLMTDFLYPELLKKLYAFVSTYPEEHWQKEINQEYSNRLKLNWIPESVIEETHMVMENLTPSLNEIYSRTDKFLGISIWKDGVGYGISKHVDIPLIDISLQIYLSPDFGNYGTEFYYGNEKFDAPYTQNSGYLLGERIPHSMTKTISKNHTRYSLYAIWQQ